MTLLNRLGFLVWLNRDHVILSDERFIPNQAWRVLDPECPAFLRKILGYPLGWTLSDPATPALFRKRVGFKLELHHVEAAHE